MAVTLTDPPRIRDTLLPRRDGTFDLHAAFNREIYPALKGLRDWVIGTVTTIITVLNRFEPVFLTGAANSVTIEHDGKILFVSHGSATTLTIDAATTDGFELGAAVYMVQQGAGQLTVAGSGVTIISAETLRTRKQWSALAMVKYTATDWFLTGDMELF